MASVEEASINNQKGRRDSTAAAVEAVEVHLESLFKVGRRFLFKACFL
jgi:hypothetical protein